MTHSEFHFLVVDDLPTVRYIVAKILNTLGYANVSEAEDGAIALRLLLSGDAIGPPIDFVVTDWNMPVMNGLALLKKIRSHADLGHLPVLMVTTEAAQDNMIAATQAGADGYIAKQLLNAATLKAIIDSILKKRGLPTGDAC